MNQLIGALADLAACAAAASTPPRAPVKKMREKALESTPAARPASHTSPSPKRHEEGPPDLAGAFHRRSSLLTALIALEVLGPPPALRPRELRGDVW